MSKPTLMFPYAKVVVGKGESSREYIWGDGKLRNVSITLSEGKNLSNCSISIFDENREEANLFFAYVKEVGGLEPVVIGNEEEKATPQTNGGGTAAIGDLEGAEVRAVLDMIAWAEGTSGLGDNGYNVMFTGKLFNGYDKHPDIVNRGSGIPSTAAGRYQFLTDTWNGVKAQAGLTDFKPKSQDLGAVQLLKNRNAYNHVLNREWPQMLDDIAAEWASLPRSDGTYAYSGQGSKTPQEVYDFLDNALSGTPKTEQEETTEAAVESTETTPETNEESPGRETTLAGQQITIYLGFDNTPIVAYSFIHTGLNYNLYEDSTLTFTGSAAAWVMNQEKKNSAFINISLKQLAQKVASSYGLTVDMNIEGPRYVYIPQKALSDYELLLRECERVGLIIKNVGNKKIEIKARDEIIAENDNKIFYIELHKNVSKFSVEHKAQGTSKGGARSPEEPSRTGVKKYTLNPDTGAIEANETEIKQTSDATESTTGDNNEENKPLTDGVGDLEDSARKANEMRVKGIIAQFTTPATANTLLLTPDDVIQSKGFSSNEIDVLDRVWTCESITHSLGETYETSGVIYTPLKNRYPGEPEVTATEATGPAAAEVNPDGFIKPTEGVLTSGFGPRKGGNHGGVDISKHGDNVPVWAAADGTVSAIETGCPLNGSIRSDCGGGYGNLVYISHPDGTETRYAHLRKVFVTNTQEVKQGQQIGLQGNSGRSTGQHLHFEIRINGQAVNPAQYINF